MNTLIKIDGVDYSESIEIYEMTSKLDGGSTSSVFGSLEYEELEVNIFGNVDGSKIEVSFEYEDKIKPYDTFIINDVEYDDARDVTTIKAHTDLSELDVEFDMPDAKDTDELLTKLGLPKAPKNVPIVTTEDKYYPNKLKLVQDIAALTGSFVTTKGGLRFVTPTNTGVQKINWEDFELSGNKENLISQGWDSFEPYGSGKNYVDNWDFTNDDMSMWGNYSKNKDNTISVDYGWSCRQDITLPKGEYQVRVKHKLDSGKGKVRVSSALIGMNIISTSRDEWHVHESVVTVDEDVSGPLYILNADRTEGVVRVDWIQITPVDDQHLVVEKTPLENGLTRIQTWGGSQAIKLVNSDRIDVSDNDYITQSMMIQNIGHNNVVWRDNRMSVFYRVPPGKSEHVTLEGHIPIPRLYSNIRVDNVTDNLDFIASDPQIVEGDVPNAVMVVDTLDDGRSLVEVLNPNPDTKLTYKGGTGANGEPYELKTKIDNLGRKLHMETNFGDIEIGKGYKELTFEGNLDGSQFEIDIGALE